MMSPNDNNRTITMNTEMTPLIAPNRKDSPTNTAEEGRVRFDPKQHEMGDLIDKVTGGKVDLKETQVAEKSYTEIFFKWCPEWLKNFLCWIPGTKILPIFAIWWSFFVKIGGAVGKWWQTSEAAITAVGGSKAYFVLEDTNLKAGRNEDALKILLNKFDPANPQRLATVEDIESKRLATVEDIESKMFAALEKYYARTGNESTAAGAEEEKRAESDGAAVEKEKHAESGDVRAGTGTEHHAESTAVDDPDSTEGGDEQSSADSNDGEQTNA